MTREQIEIIKEAYADIELDEPTQEEWDGYLLRQHQDTEADRYAAIPEREI